MPTILLLDNSLSMARRPGPSSKLTYLELAVSSAHQVLAYLTRHAPVEFVALGLVGPELDMAFPFTQDLSGMQQYLPSICPGTVANLAPAVEAACLACLREFGPRPPAECRLLLLTDSGAGRADASSAAAAEAGIARAADAMAAAGASLCALCLAQGEADGPGGCLAQLQLQAAAKGCQVSVGRPADRCSLKSVSEAVQAICLNRLAPCTARLHCGSVGQTVELHPCLPGPLCSQGGSDRGIRLIGFLQISELYSPAVQSRHLILPTLTASGDTATTQPSDQQSQAHQQQQQQPLLTTLLQAALRADSYAALVVLSQQQGQTESTESVYGFLHAHPGGRRCTLLLSVLRAGEEPACWLGKIPYLAPASDFDDAALANATPFPVKPKGTRPSYAGACIVWTKQASVVADVQKVSRWARKLPEKSSQFYQELNRLRRHAVSIGFVELLTAVRELLQRERDAAAAGASGSNSAAKQIEHLNHVVSMLRPPNWGAEILPPPPPPQQRHPEDGVIDLTVPSKQRN